MNTVNLTVEVHYHRPPWMQALNNDLSLIYRLYINDILLTERTWRWANNIFIQENIWIHAEKNSSHIITIEPILLSKHRNGFVLTNLTVINTPFTSEKINDLTISFTL